MQQRHVGRIPESTPHNAPNPSSSLGTPPTEKTVRIAGPDTDAVHLAYAESFADITRKVHGQFRSGNGHS